MPATSPVCHLWGLVPVFICNDEFLLPEKTSLDRIQEIFPAPAGILHNNFQSILFSYLESPLYINQFLFDDFSSLVADIITVAYPFHRILSLQFLRNSLRTSHLCFNQIKAFLSVSEKCFPQDICHNLWEILPGWGRRSRLRQPNSGKIYRKVGRADCGNDFSDTL